MTPEYIGVDLHKAFFRACAVTVSGERLWEGRFPRTAEGLERFTARLGAPAHVAVEACGPTWPFVDALVPSGAAICVVDPRKTKLKAGFAAKTDRLDVRRLADALRRDRVVSVDIPPPAIRELRELCRGRHQVLRWRTRLAQMIRAWLLRNGVGEPPVRKLYAPRAQTWLAAVQLPGDAGRYLAALTRVYHEVHAEAQAAEASVTTRARADAIAMALDELRGMGPVLALTLRAEIGDITRFADGAALASYAGLVPRIEQSGGRLHAGRITRQGSPWLRWALVEVAVHAINRRDGTGRWARRLALRKGLAKARVALARKLCDDVVARWPQQASA